MKKILQTTLLTAFVILVTTSFSYAQFSVTGNDNFPFFHLGCLIIGGLIIISLKRKYAQLYMSEAIGSFALYTLLVALFTLPVVDALKSLINSRQCVTIINCFTLGKFNKSFKKVYFIIYPKFFSGKSIITTALGPVLIIFVEVKIFKC